MYRILANTYRPKRRRPEEYLTDEITDWVASLVTDGAGTLLIEKHSAFSARCLEPLSKTTASPAIRATECGSLGVSTPTGIPQPRTGRRSRFCGQKRRSSSSFPRLHRPAMGRDGRPPCPGLRHAAPSRERVAFCHRVQWTRLEHAEDVGAAVGAIPCRALRRTGYVDDREGSRRSGVHRPAWRCAAKLQLGGRGCSDQPLRSARRRTRPSRRSLRTTCGTRQPAWPSVLGANVKAVQRMLGHAKASMTLDVYADLFDEDLDGVAVPLDAAIQICCGRLRTGGKSRPGPIRHDLLNLVELRGFEPLTYSMRTSRATNCAIAPGR